jgi:hypothetical protein
MRARLLIEWIRESLIGSMLLGVWYHNQIRLGKSTASDLYTVSDSYKT